MIWWALIRSKLTCRTQRSPSMSVRRPCELSTPLSIQHVVPHSALLSP